MLRVREFSFLYYQNFPRDSKLRLESLLVVIPTVFSENRSGTYLDDAFLTLTLIIKKCNL